ncbi:hypothetical protein [Crateriforma spongiae]|uniref:hypothetical protein n=1 Tax=Crateriforma spongiae TaxID=2724528 RepID=UPI0039AF66F3
MSRSHSDIPDHLRIRFLRRWKCRLMWPLATSSERQGCFRIAYRGGTFSFHSTTFPGPCVQCVYLRCLPANDGDLLSIANFRHCEAIDLGGTDISDCGIQYLAGMERLQYLFLWHTRISDASIAFINRIRQLRMLSVYNTSITERGVDTLNRSLPNCLLCLGDDCYRFGDFRDGEALRLFLAS